MKELLAEMEKQAKYLAASGASNPQEAADLQKSLFEGAEHGDTAV